MDKQLKVVISAEVAKFKKGVQDAVKDMQGFSGKSEKEIKKIDDALKEAGTTLTDWGKKAGTALAAFGGALIGTAAATEEYRANQAKLNAAFETAGATTEAAKQTYTDLYKVLGESDQAVEAANHLAKMTANEQELAEWTNICQGVYATFGDSLPIEGLTEAANETAKVGTVTGSLADALNWAGVSEDEFNEKLAKCNDEAEREQLIRETLSGLYDEAAAKYGENAGAIMAQREAQAKLQETLAKVGEAMAPVLTAFTNFANEALGPVAEKIAPLAEKYGPQLSDAMSAAGEAVGKAFGFFVDNWGIIAAIAGVVGGIAAAIGLYNAVAAIKAAMDAAQVTTLTALIAAQWAHVTATAAALAPYLLIVAAIAAVIAIIVLCVKNWDKIKAKTAEVWAAMKEKTTAAVEAVKGKLEQLKAAMTEKVEAAKAAVVEKFNAIKQGISDKIQAAKSAVSSTFDGIRSTISDKVSAAKSTVVSVFDGIRSGIKSKIDAAKDAVSSAIEKIKSFFNFKWELPKLKMPHISISGKFSINPPSVPKFSISWHKLGGVFDTPTLFGYNGGLHGLGEDGAEAIVPLEKNTQWLDKIAERLSAKTGNGNIILQVDGKTFAQVAINSINSNTRQTGKLGLQLV